MVEIEIAAECPSCGTDLSRERESTGLCPSCLIQLALDDTSAEAEILLEADEAPTLQFSAKGFSEGDIQGERYRIRSLLGRGGMGEVWRAYDLKLRLDVALKSLRPELVADKQALETLRQEVRVAREVISPNVCRVFDLQEFEGQELVSMEYVDGITLQEMLKERGPLGLNEARELASQFLAGLEAIHAADLVHRDIKPENIMITRTGRVVVMDFGIAKGLGDGKTGLVAGTPAYMSPEQAKGGDIDARADLFSVGVVLAEMIEPGGLETFEDRKRIWEGLRQDPPQIAETPWANAIAKAVTADREDRFENAAALARALEEVTLRAAGDETVQPYPGLSAFQQEDAEYFYGRELEVEALWKKLRRPHLLAVIGPSGAGKSSFLRAGLLPTLNDGWQALIATPGNRPFASLARVLAERLPTDPVTVDALLRFEEPEIAADLISQWREGARHGLIILDQFEELFTQNPQEVQQRFTEMLGSLPLRADVHVLLSMRDDFLFHCQAFESLTPLFSELTPLGPPTGASLRRAIVQPALKCGYRFEDEGMVEEMLSEVEGQRGALPLLAFAAAQLWEHRDRETGLLTRKNYEQIGGVGGALAQHAEAMLDYIGESNTPIVRELFRNLVTAQGTRASRDREELLSVFPESEGDPFLEPSKVRPTPVPKPQRPAAKHVLNALTDARLLTSYEIPAAENDDAPHQRIEIVHESLLANWPRLVRWRTQDAQGAQLRDELRSQAKLWDEHGRTEDYLWTGTAFKEYELWRESYPGGLTEVEEAFGAAMVHLAERQKRRRRIALSAAFGVLLVVLGVIAWFGWQAELERRRAEAGRLLALGELEMETYPSAALAWATKSIEVLDTEEGRFLAVRALQKAPPLRALVPDEGEIVRTTFSPSGDWLATAGFSNINLHPNNGDGLMPIHRYSGMSTSPTRLAFQSEDVLVVERQGECRWWSVPDGSEIRRVEGERGKLQYALGDGYFSWSEVEGEGLMYWWPFEEGDSRLVGSMPGLYNFDIDASGSWMVYEWQNNVYQRSIRSWEQMPSKIGEYPGEAWNVWLHPEGDLVAVQNDSGQIDFWSIEAGPSEPVRSLDASGFGMAGFDPSGNWLAARGNLNGRPTMQLWDLRAPQGAEPIAVMKGDEVFHNSNTFHPNEPWAVVGHTGAASFWPLLDRYPWVLEGAGGDDLVFTPNSDWLLVPQRGRGVTAWPLKGQNRGQSRILIEEPLFAFTLLGLAPSGDQFAVATRDRGVVLVPLSGGSIRELPGRWSNVFAMYFAFSPDGRFLAAAPDNGRPEEMVLRVWNLESGQVQMEALVPGNMGYLGFDDNRHLRWSGFPFDLEKKEGGGERVFDLEDGSVETVAEFGREFGRLYSPDEEFMLTLEMEGNGEGYNLFWKSLMRDESRVIDYNSDSLFDLEIGPSGEWMVTGDEEGLVRVGPISEEEPHTLFGGQGMVRAVAISPDGRWIAASDHNKTLRIWPTPDWSQTPVHALPHDELIAKLHSLTNVRIVEDSESSTGWKLDYAPFPGWAEVPSWP